MVVWLSWNFEILFQTDAESFSFLSWKTKSFIPKKNIFLAVVNIKTKKFCLLTQFSGRFWSDVCFVLRKNQFVFKFRFWFRFRVFNKFQQRKGIEDYHHDVHTVYICQSLGKCKTCWRKLWRDTPGQISTAKIDLKKKEKQVFCNFIFLLSNVVQTSAVLT